MNDFRPGDRRPQAEPTVPRDLELTDADAQLLQQVRAVLTPMPPVDRRHIAQILAATQTRQRTPWQRVVARFADLVEWWRFDTPPLARGASLAAAALMVGFVARGYVMRGSDAARASSTQVAESRTVSRGVPANAETVAPLRAPAQAAGSMGDGSEFRVPVQFMLDARDVPAGTTVSVVGDFNGWDVTATPLTLEQGVWSTTLPLTPGRHVYAFVVNGTTWLADPRAPQSTDNDFGRPGSVIIVQQP